MSKFFNNKKNKEKLGDKIKITLPTVKVVGTYVKSKNFGFVIPDDRKIKKDIFISNIYNKNAKNKQKVVVEIIKEEADGKKPEGRIIEILGFMGEDGVDMLSIIKQFDLPYEFSKEVLEEAKRVSKEPIKLENRRDLRNENIVTIDGKDAKDLDDAIIVKKLDNGYYTLGVHIADVSHYVREGTELNKEAINRGTSVYMLNKVIPMLPEVLSNGCCSLNENVDRYALSVEMKISSSGEVVDSEVFKSVINVKKRMDYESVQKVLDNSDEEVIKEYERYIKDIKLMEELAIILKNAKLVKGYLSLEIPETKLILDNKGKPIEIKPYEDYFSNQIIEQFMLLANETIAEKFFWLEAPFIYRVHENPSQEKVEAFNSFLLTLGYKIKGKFDELRPKSFQAILEKAKNTKEERVVSNLLLRTLKMANYSAENLGHFGIASKYYCHFTSPIRRYPDLFIHRIISKYIEFEYNVTDWFKEKYKNRAEKYAIRSSECEQNATKAERESIDMKKAEYMEDKIGEVFEGVISSVTNFGFFVELENTVEGLVRFETLKDDYYIYNEETKTLVGRVKNKIFKLGDTVLVEVISASKGLRRVDFKVIDENEEKIEEKIEEENQETKVI